ncbi:MAG: hypothetical protein R3204_16795, partial [Oceanospirillum sp.]|nr:hypothetical protein [Oceanospirillum sp.]
MKERLRLLEQQFIEQGKTLALMRDSERIANQRTQQQKLFNRLLSEMAQYANSSNDRLSLAYSAAKNLSAEIKRGVDEAGKPLNTGDLIRQLEAQVTKIKEIAKEEAKLAAGIPLKKKTENVRQLNQVLGVNVRELVKVNDLMQTFGKVSRISSAAARTQSKQQERVNDVLGQQINYLATLNSRLQTFGKISVISTSQARREWLENEKQVGRNTRANKGFLTGLNRLNPALGLTRNLLDGMGRHISVYTGGTLGAAAATYGLARGIRESVSVFAEFETKIQRAGAVMGATSGEIEAMAQQARDVAKVTIFTAQETGEALVQP